MLGMVPNPITQGISTVAKTVGSFLDKPGKSGHVIQVANPGELTPRIEPAGAAATNSVYVSGAISFLPVPLIKLINPSYTSTTHKSNGIVR